MYQEISWPSNFKESRVLNTGASQAHGLPSRHAGPAGQDQPKPKSGEVLLSQGRSKDWENHLDFRWFLLAHDLPWGQIISEASLPKPRTLPVDITSSLRKTRLSFVYVQTNLGRGRSVAEYLSCSLSLCFSLSSFTSLEDAVPNNEGKLIRGAFQVTTRDHSKG